MNTIDSILTATPWLLPAVLLLLKFGLKLWISEPYNALKLWESVLQTPVDVGFLALSIIASAIIKAAINKDFATNPHDQVGVAFIFFIVYIFLIAISIVLAKNTPTGVAVKEVIKAACMAMINYILTIIMLVCGIVFIIPL